MNARLQKSILNRSEDSHNVTSSPELPAGPSRSNMRAGQQMSLFGPALAPANPSAWREKEMERVTKDTFGPLFDGLSPSADLQASLANRLRQRMAAYGSPEYALTWKRWAMPSGPPICALRASGRRTSGNDCSGWHTPQAHDSSPRGKGQKLRHGTKHGCGDLNADAQITGWATPAARDYKSESATDELNQDRLNQARGKPLSWQCAEMENYEGYRLNPFFSLHLMGFPLIWGVIGIKSYLKSKGG